MVEMSKAKHEPRPMPRRFYTAVGVQAVEGGFAVLLDGKSVKTPAKKRLQVSSLLLAEAIAVEWSAQLEVIDTDTMPLTRLASLTLDRIALDRALLLADMAGYGETDLVCYRMPQDEGAVLRARQDALFDPLLVWARDRLHMTLQVTDGLMPVAQDMAALQAIAGMFASSTDGELAALAMLVPILGSAVLTLGVWRGRMTIEEALAAAHLEEDFQAEKWGADVDLVRAWAGKCRDARAAAFFLDMQATQKPV